MREKIADFFASRKGKDIVLVLAVIMLGIITFGLGRLSNMQSPQMPVTLYVPVVASGTYEEVASAAAVLHAEPLQQGKYVASKNGNVYHLPWCSGAQRIKDTNKIWFHSAEEAQAAGLRPAANCKGI